MRRRGFTIVELLVVVAIVSMLIGILVPAIGQAREQARLAGSRSNLRQLAEAHASYAAAWNDRQLTLVHDNLASYGPHIRIAAFQFQIDAAGSGPGGSHAPLLAGFGQGGIAWAYWFDGASEPEILLPINFEGFDAYFGWFRLINVKAFNQYVGGRFYDPTFYAPKDRVVVDAVRDCLSIPFEFSDCFQNSEGAQNFVRSSYVLSPAALFNPDVFRNEPAGGFQDPFDAALPAGLRVPSMSHARYPELKSQILEHHWLQNRHVECNPSFQPGTYHGCEPYYFNHGWESVPAAAFYDGHVEGLGVAEAQAADNRHQAQAGYGLWHRGTPWAGDGYFISRGWDVLASTSFHILTTDGIRGRDTLGE